MSNWKEIVYRSYVSSGHVEDRGGSAEEQFRGRGPYLQAVIRRQFPADRTARILDIGCGHGALCYFLQKNGYRHVRGVDGSAEQVELARRMGVAGVELGDGLEFLRGCDPGSSEVVCVFDVLEHLTREQAFELIGEIRRVLSPGGCCIGHVPNAAGIFGSRVRYGDLTHEMAFTPQSIRQMFRSLGFGTVRCFEDKPIIHGAKSALRRAVWDCGTIPFRLLLAAETGEGGTILSRNLLFVGKRS